MATLSTIHRRSLWHHSDFATWLIIWLLAVLIVLIALTAVAGGMFC